jgi:hypothetical protein
MRRVTCLDDLQLTAEGGGPLPCPAAPSQGDAAGVDLGPQHVKNQLVDLLGVAIMG